MRGVVCIITMFLYCQSSIEKNSNKSFNDEANRINTFSRSAKQFCVQHRYNNTIFFLVDMQIHSGKKRFFVINMNNDSTIASGLVAHGVCGIFFSATASFSNVPNDGCSSLGRYKIGDKYTGRFGTSYKLYGLDSTNSNAFKRNIVLHSYYEIPDNEIYPAHVCNSLGCPMVSKKFFKTLSAIIDTSKKPVLLWIIN
jgi:hypothetical protein